MSNDNLRDIIRYVARLGGVDPDYALACVGEKFGIPYDRCGACGAEIKMPAPDEIRKPYKDD